MKLKQKTVVLLLIFSLFALSACNDKEPQLDPHKPVTITMWHNFGGQMQQSMDVLVDEYNNTIGKDKGIIISVVSIAAFKDIENSLQLIANGDPGAPEMPDLTVAYPKTALFLLEEGLIAPLDEFLSPTELNAYLPQFIEEGRLPDNKLYVFPIAKSTEVLFVNKTLFDRFAGSVNLSLEDLTTFEGIAKASSAYAKWSDEQTPTVENDSASFYTADSWFNIALVGSAQLGDQFIEPNRLLLDNTSYKSVWDFTVQPAALGGHAITSSYSSDLSKTGEIICSTGSTAGILFYGDSVTYPDNTIESVEFVVLPYPTFANGTKVALQRGAGMVVAKSNPVKEEAAVHFLKWLTQPDQNINFISMTGYLPVTKDAFENRLTDEMIKVENSNIRQLLEVAITMFQEYDFLTAPNYDAYDELSKAYEAQIKQIMLTAHNRYLAGENLESLLEELREDLLK